MLGMKIRTCILLLFALLLQHSKCLPFTSQETRNSNLDSAMVGFDPFLANAYEQFDPGFRSKIFLPREEDFTSKFNTYSLPNKYSNYFSCALQFTSNILTNFSDYESDKESRFSITQDEIDDKNDDVNEAYVEDVFSDGLEKETEENIIRKFFLETNGEIVQNKITCIAQEVTISAFASPGFTADFSAALQALQLAAKNSDPEYSKKIYRKFVGKFGTHYMKTSKMGAEIIFQKLFTEKEINDKIEEAQQNCLKSSARRSIANGAKSVESVISDFSELSETCDYSSEGKEYFTNNGIESSRVIINGPPPIGNMEQWNTAVKESPVPINFELEKLSSLLLRTSSESKSITGDGSNLHKVLLHNLLETEYSRYCTSMKGKHCSPDILCCGEKGDCPPGFKCKKVLNSSDTLDAANTSTTAVVDIGGVIVTGGYTGSTVLSDVESINTWQLPNLPEAMCKNTLSQVGSKLFNCGGLTRHTGGHSIDNCYTLDLLSHPPIWESSPKLPKPMHAHSAVTIGSHIWFTHNNQLTDFSTEDQLFRDYSLPMVVPEYHCAVSNDTHSYIIGVGGGRKEIWINKYPSSPEEWSLVAHLPSDRKFQGCLWFEDNVLIAGGYRSGSHHINLVELLNTRTNTVTVTGPLLQGRHGQGMFVLDGEPVVMGGYVVGKYLDTIESFDMRTKTWRQNDRKMLMVREWFGLVQLR